jgi:hypothetical protein
MHGTLSNAAGASRSVAGRGGSLPFASVSSCVARSTDLLPQDERLATGRARAEEMLPQMPIHRLGLEDTPSRL